MKDITRRILSVLFIILVACAVFFAWRSSRTVIVTHPEPGTAVGDFFQMEGVIPASWLDTEGAMGAELVSKKDPREYTGAMIPLDVPAWKRFLGLPVPFAVNFPLTGDGDLSRVVGPHILRISDMSSNKRLDIPIVLTGK